MKVLQSTTVPVLAVITDAIESTKLLCETIIQIQIQDRPRTLRTLRHEVEGLANILESLKQVNDAETVLEFLRGPIARCDQVCRQFEPLIKVFSETLTTGRRDWTKMKFMGGDIPEFITTVEIYKSTISIGLGTITLLVAIPYPPDSTDSVMRNTCNASQEAVQQYQEMIQNTLYDIKVRLELIYERREQMTAGDRYLLICEEAEKCNETFTHQALDLQARTQNASDDKGQLPAATLICETLHGNGVSLRETIGHLEQNNPNYKEILELREERKATEQCFEVCKKSNDTYRKRSSVGVTSQVMVTTLAGLFIANNATSNGNSQLIGQYNSEQALSDAVREHYKAVDGTSDYGI